MTIGHIRAKYGEDFSCSFGNARGQTQRSVNVAILKSVIERFLTYFFFSNYANFNILSRITSV